MHNTTFLQVYLNKNFSIQLLQGSKFVEGKITVCRGQILRRV